MRRHDGSTIARRVDRRTRQEHQGGHAMPRGPAGPPPASHAPRAPRGAPLAERIDHYVERTADGCWLWCGPWLASHQAGYLVIDNHKRLAHRIAWELAHGSIPPAH